MDEKPLLLLRDIHQPPDISWWPLAPGWWLLVALVIIALIVSWHIFYPRWCKHRKQRAWQVRIAKLEALAAKPKRTHAALMLTSKLLHQLAHKKYPEKTPSELTDKAWVTFLKETFTGEISLDSQLTHALVIGPYSPRIELSAQERQQLFAFVKAWVVQHV